MPIFDKMVFAVPAILATTVIVHFYIAYLELTGSQNAGTFTSRLNNFYYR